MRTWPSIQAKRSSTAEPQQQNKNTTQPSPGNDSDGTSAHEYSKQMFPACEQVPALPTATCAVGHGWTLPLTAGLDLLPVYIISRPGSI